MSSAYYKKEFNKIIYSLLKEKPPTTKLPLSKRKRKKLAAYEFNEDLFIKINYKVINYY